MTAHIYVPRRKTKQPVTLYLNMLEFGEFLGSGTFHDVYLNKQNPKLVVRQLRPRKNMDLLESQQKMREILSSPIRTLLPTDVTNYNELGCQLVTRCARLETGGGIENLNGGSNIRILDTQMERWAVNFLYVLQALSTNEGTRPAFFDGKMDNMGVEKLSDGSLELRIIDVDPDDGSATYTCFTGQYWKTNKVRLLSSKTKDAFIRYQSTFSVIAAFIAWMLPDAETSEEFTEQLYIGAEKPLPFQIRAMYSAAPRLGWLRYWLLTAHDQDRWPTTFKFLNNQIDNLRNQYNILKVPAEVRASFVDLAVSQSSTRI